jgi:hypothetical protein
MHIEFLNQVMPKPTAMGTVSFQVLVDGEYLWCEISCEALRAHFGALSTKEEDLLYAFHTGRAKIEETTRCCLEENGGRAVLLMMVDF